MEDVGKQIQKLKKLDESAENLIHLGNLYLKKQDKLEARYYFQQAIEKYPSHIEGYIKLGEFSLEQNKLKEANNHFSKAYDIDSKNVEVLIGLIKTHLKRDGLSFADRYSEKAIKVAPENVEILFLAGLTKLKQHNIFYAKKYLNLAMEKQDAEFMPFIRFYLGVLLVKQGLFETALDHFRAIQESAPFQNIDLKNGQALRNNVAYTEFRVGNIEKAEKLFVELTSTAKAVDPYIWVNLGQIYWIQNKVEDAVKALETAHKMDSRSWPWMRETREYLETGEKGLAQKINGLMKENPNGLNLGMYLGCVIPNRYPFIDAASRHVLDAMKVGVAELEGAGCCPAPGVFRSFDINTWMTLGARNITIAEDMNRNMCIMCNGCFGTLNDINTELKEDKTKRDFVNKQLKEIGKEFKGTVDAEHLVWILFNDIGIENIKKKIVHKLGYKVAVHYGCHIIKPSHNKPWADSSETPEFIDKLVEITGCQSVPYRDKLMCCGAGGGLRGSEKEISLDFTRDKLESIRNAGVDIIIDCCPFCHLQLDLGQMEINGLFKDKISAPFKIPVIYITQLLGLAMGMDPYRLGLQKTPVPKGLPPFTPVDSIFTQLSDDLDL
ncbi:hypothetical protein NEF87_000189 [Candidatus Lokiarchaeum ossiferum]|uniref:Cysteine-rich domain-containing protein n=1 Tax=Candidatus Lokiarchaeum ossiferum TaxID=2951803 RepID=A0ABY6HN32_9ARCH|nr:hypothetical protein NEF87_000189 [Candidatus Lokiarchaeum sp. B-35]